MDENYTAGSVVSDSSPATVGMFGDNNNYYFYFKFKPANSEWAANTIDGVTITAGTTFRVLF